MSKLYVAYGSNINLTQMAFRCPTAEPVCTATLKGYNLEFRGSKGNAYATISPGDGDVPVLVWSIEDADEQALNCYEGYPHLYRKEIVTVELNGECVDAMVYVMNGQELNMPSDAYLGVILDGYEAVGLNTSALANALTRSTPERDYEMEHSGQLEWW